MRPAVRWLRALVAGVMTLSLSPAFAQQDAPALDLDLNRLETSKAGCRLTFVVTNGLGGALTRAAFEVALFDDRGMVDRIALLEFRALPVRKTKVTRFEIAGMDCARIGRVLVNDATECEGAGIEPAACVRFLKTNSTAGVAFGG